MGRGKASRYGFYPRTLPKCRALVDRRQLTKIWGLSGTSAEQEECRGRGWHPEGEAHHCGSPDHADLPDNNLQSYEDMGVKATQGTKAGHPGPWGLGGSANVRPGKLPTP